MNHQHPQPQPLAQVGTAYDLQRIAEAASSKQRDVAGQIAPAPQSQVEAALSQIDAGMQDLQNTVNRITGRLEPVLSAGEISAEGGAEQTQPASSTPLVRRLNHLAANLRKDCTALQDLERRLAL